MFYVVKYLHWDVESVNDDTKNNHFVPNQQ